MTTPTLHEATKRLAGSLPAKPEWDRGSVAVRTEDLAVVTEALSGYQTAVDAQTATDGAESVGKPRADTRTDR